MSVIDASGLAKSYGPRRVLAGVDLALRPHERVGLVGRNGCGKSTLGRILAGIEAPDTGAVARQRGASVEYLAQEPSLPPEESLRSIVLSSLGAWSAARQRYDDLTARLAEGVEDPAALAAEQAAAAIASGVLADGTT